MRRLERLAVLARRPHAGVMQGDRKSLRRGQSVEFADYRAYVRGDDLRQLDWNAYARLERFFVKLFVAEEDLRLHIMLDASRSMAWGEPSKLDFARRVAAALGYVALVNLDWVAVAPFSERLQPQKPPLRGRGAASSLFATLSAIAPHGGTDLAAALKAYAAAATRPGPLVLLSDLYDPGWEPGLRALLGRRFDVTVVHLLSPEEIAPSLEGDFRLIDDETGQPVELTADEITLARYREVLGRWQADLHRWCSDRGATYIPVATDLAVETFVTDVMRRRGLVG